jgi:cation:H+ antiporter
MNSRVAARGSILCRSRWQVEVLYAWIFLVIGLIVILVGCDIFTNSIEWLGKKLNLNEGVLGSIFAAVGTALPETLIPVVAVLFGSAAAAGEGGGGHSEEVGIGAIIGAPFMLTTVAMFVTGLSAYIFTRRGRRTSIEMRVNSRILSRDIRFFLLPFLVAAIAGFITEYWIKIVIAISMVFYYAFYVYKHATDKHEPEATDEEVEELSPLHFARRSPEPSMGIVVAQVLFGLGMIIAAAFVFVQNVDVAARSLGVSSLILSLIIVPLATELPEKFNSILWIRRTKDTLALGNITGAMVFQSTLPVAFGLAFTEWRASPEYAPAFLQAIIAVIAAAILLGSMMLFKRLTARALVLSGLWYIVWIIIVFPLDLEHMVQDWGIFR